MSLLLQNTKPTVGQSPSVVPVVVIGAGPVGLAAAAELLGRGIEPLVLEAGPRAGAAVSVWGHVRLFSPWRYVVAEPARRLLVGAGWSAPDPEGLPTGRELVEEYLLPLAAVPVLADHIRYGTRVLAVSRHGMDRTRTVGRAERPFLVRTVQDGATVDVLADAVIDTSGTTSSPNGLLASGLDPVALDQLREHLSGGLPDVLGTARARFAGQRVLVVGAGHSAATTLIALAVLAEQEPATRITWAIRNQTPARVYTAATDQLSERASLGAQVAGLVEAGSIELLTRFEVDDIQAVTDGVQVIGRHDDALFALEVDQVVAATGYRPNLGMLREVRLALDEIVEAPRELAPLIDPNLHSCGTVPPHGVVELTHSEPRFYLAGMKSYGRAPTFLLLTGYEQVRSIAAELAGDHDAARQVQLVLPETGVCITSGSAGCDIEFGADTCCTSPAGVQPLQLLPSVPAGGSCCG